MNRLSQKLSALVNLSVSVKECSVGFQKSLRESLSSFLILTCRKACFRSPDNATGWNRTRVRTFHSLFWSGGPAYKHSLRLGDCGFSRADPSYTTGSFVDSAPVRTTGLWGR